MWYALSEINLLMPPEATYVKIIAPLIRGESDSP